MRLTLFLGVYMITYKFFNHLPPEAVSIRQTVFVAEQGFHNEFDDIDERALHLIVYADGKAVGNLRTFADDTALGTYIIGRLAVLKEYRRFHLGQKLMLAVEAEIKRLGGTKIMLSAQCQAQKFYEKLGYTASSAVYLDEHCPHIHMEKNI